MLFVFWDNLSPKAAPLESGMETFGSEHGYNMEPLKVPGLSVELMIPLQQLKSEPGIGNVLDQEEEAHFPSETRNLQIACGFGLIQFCTLLPLGCTFFD